MLNDYESYKIFNKLQKKAINYKKKIKNETVTKEMKFDRQMDIFSNLDSFVKTK